MIGKVVYFAASGTTSVCRGRIMKKNIETNKYFIQNIEQSGYILLTDDEFFDTEQEAKSFIMKKIRDRYAHVIEEFTPEELLEYLISLLPVRNELDIEIRDFIIKSIEKHFNIFLD